MMQRLKRTMQVQVCIILVAGTLLGTWDVEKVGDRLQVALPVAGLVCAVANGEAGSYFLRFTGTMLVVHGFKRGLGEAEINLRPTGNAQGFPSGHTAAAVFGASYLVNDCLVRNKALQGVAILSGAYVGASRIEAGKHFLFQVMLGALTGWLGERSVAALRVASLALRRLRYRKQRMQT